MSELAQSAESPELSDAFEKLVREAARLQTVIDTVPSFLWTSLPDGSKEYLNKRWYEYTGLPMEQAKGWGWKVVVHPDDLDRLVREWFSLVEARKPGELETRIRRYDGVYRWIAARLNSFTRRGGSGRTRRASAYGHSGGSLLGHQPLSLAISAVSFFCGLCRCLPRLLPGRQHGLSGSAQLNRVRAAATWGGAGFRRRRLGRNRGGLGHRLGLRRIGYSSDHWYLLQHLISAIPAFFVRRAKVTRPYAGTNRTSIRRHAIC